MPVNMRYVCCVNQNLSIAEGLTGLQTFSRMPPALNALSPVTVDDIEGRYEFVDELGEGASSKVFLAAPRDAPETEVAIKVLDATALAADDEQCAAVLAEVRALQEVRHPHVVALVETCRDASSFAIVTEGLTGGDLFQRLKESGDPLNEPVAKVIFAQCCSALEYLHQCGYCHRDVKAENIVCVDDEQRQDVVKLIDLGSSAPIVASDGAHIPLSGLHATAHYCAPEIITSTGGFGGVEATNLPYDERCDLWSLGVLLYFILSRKLPFAASKERIAGRAPSDGAEDEDGLLRRVADGSYTFEPASVWEQVSAEAKDLISKLMKKSPDERLGWEGVRAHPWCAASIQERDAAVAKWFDSEGIQRVNKKRSPPAPGGGTKSALRWDGSGGAVERRAHAAAAASERLQAILARKRRGGGATSCCNSATSDEQRAIAVV